MNGKEEGAKRLFSKREDGPDQPMTSLTKA